ncbi:HPr kinase/phosphorylase [Acidocella sp.]|jgi:HPr kinase/phosphorylase|uniref:HPr kinase/phosphorylase n=1 Tax=Acidocella sp. TaxID=50710 RepID=UPI002601B659|nr:phosphotransferase [Acidocella sp.]
MHWHASCAARQSQPGGDALLILGPSGAGKSDLLLRLIHAGFTLVADDQVIIEDGQASPPAPLAGLLEVRGLGLFRLAHIAPARLRLVIALGATPAERLPSPCRHPDLGLPLIHLEAAHPAAPARAALALEAACGRVAAVAGALAP